MRTLPVKSSARHGSDQGHAPEKRHQMIAVAANCRAERQGIRGGEELSGWLRAEAEVEHPFAPPLGNEPKTSTKQGFQQELEAQLREWDVKLLELRAKARDAKAEIRAEFAVQLEALASERALAEEKLQELRQHGEWAWEDLKDGAQEIWSELHEAIKRSASRFK